MIVRSEQPADFEAIGVIHETAFGHAFEKEMIAGLRKEPDFEPDWSLVAEEDGKVYGHVLFTHVTIEDAFHSVPAVVLGPLAVLPEARGKNIGTALVEEGIRRCTAKGETLMLVCGHGFYPRFGFRPAEDYSVFRPNPIKGEHFQLLELTPDAAHGVRGVVKYPRPFVPSLFKWYFPLK